MALEHMNHTVKVAGDAVSIFTVVATLSQALPAIAALVTIIWTGIRIFETDTVRKLLGKEPLNEEGQSKKGDA
jgi:hypothetical protein